MVSLRIYYFSQGLPSREVQWSGNQSGNANQLASAFSGRMEDPLDFHFWGQAQNHVYREQPESIESLIQCAKTFAAPTIRKVADNV